MTSDIVMDLVPGPPSFAVDWARLNERFAWLGELRGCPQDPIHHAEGDVFVHTRMVLGALALLPRYRAAPERIREEVFLAALFHDIAKPATTEAQPDGRVTARGHARKGMFRARRWLQDADFDPVRRERVVHLVLHHQLPMWCIEKDDPERHAILASLVCCLDDLSLLAEADMRGRHCADQPAALERIALFAALAEDLDCRAKPFAFANDHTRLMYVRRPEQHHTAELHHEPTCTMTLLCGLPGSGKSTWARDHHPALPVVSLDALRDQHGVGPRDNQGRIVQEAKELARQHLRAHRSFLWDATNLSRSLRAPLIQLGLDYGARVEVVHVETSNREGRRRNRDRDRPVPDEAIERMVRRWEPPTALEAHSVIQVVT